MISKKKRQGTRMKRMLKKLLPHRHLISNSSWIACDGGYIKNFWRVVNDVLTSIDIKCLLTCDQDTILLVKLELIGYSRDRAKIILGKSPPIFYLQLNRLLLDNMIGQCFENC